MNWRETLLKFYRETFHLHHWTMTAASLDYWQAMRDSQWTGERVIRDGQLEKLTRLLEHAYENVPYYRKVFDEAGVRPHEVQGLDDLAKVPLLSKKTVKEGAEGSLLARDFDTATTLKIRTSGSTGMPLHIHVDVRQLDMRYAAVMRCWEWTGWRFGDRTMRLWHQTIGMTEEQVAREWLDAFLMRREFLPVFEMNDENLLKYVLTIKEYLPKVMDGYAEAFAILARFIETNDIDDVCVPAVISSAQMLPEGTRARITKAMHTEVFDRYGCREFSTIAHECEKHRNYHINAENLVVELIRNGRPARPGEMGEVVVTDLNNYCQPIIRYRLGDLAECVEGRCSCGRGLPMIGKILGRTSGVVVGSNGTYLTTSFFLHYLKDYEDEIRQFQVVQESRSDLVVRVIPEDRQRGLSAESQDRIVRDFRNYLGDDVAVGFELTDAIPMVKTGKHVSVISKLSADLQEF